MATPANNGEGVMILTTPTVIATFNKPVVFDDLVNFGFGCVIISDDVIGENIGISDAFVYRDDNRYILRASNRNILAEPVLSLSDDGLSLYANWGSVIFIVGAVCEGNHVSYPSAQANIVLNPVFLSSIDNGIVYQMAMRYEGRFLSFCYDLDYNDATLIFVTSQYDHSLFKKVSLTADNDAAYGSLTYTQILTLLECIIHLYHTSESIEIRASMDEPTGDFTSQFNIFTGRITAIPPLPLLSASFENNRDVMSIVDNGYLLRFNRPITESELIDIRLGCLVQDNNNNIVQATIGRFYREGGRDLYIMTDDLHQSIAEATISADRMAIKINTGSPWTFWFYALKLGSTPYRVYQQLDEPTLLVNLPLVDSERLIALALPGDYLNIKIFTDDGTSGGDIAYLASNGQLDYSTPAIGDGVNRLDLNIGKIFDFLEIVTRIWYGNIEAVSYGSFVDSGITIDDISTTYDLRLGIVSPFN